MKKKKSKVWTTRTADTKFSIWIRSRDGNKCLRCGTIEQLTNSHFWARNKSALRYEPDNCITLCLWKCHIYGWEKEKQGAYRDFMVARLGQKRYDELKEIYYKSTMNRRQAILACMKLLYG